MSKLFEKRCDALREIFTPLSVEKKYEKLIELGKKTPPYPTDAKVEKNLVKGCQSAFYLTAHTKDDLITFSIHSEALISKGLGAILLFLYSDAPIDLILSSPPTIVQELGILANLSFNRSNGFLHIYLRMKKLAIASPQTSSLPL